ncbi:MAG: hypothetical protein HY300_03965 [Verrucomicrobia bacterium]|nr:hypothetical protein [Verrucomicrobiota bacterium]
MSAPPAGVSVDRLVLQGDDEDFDNTVFVIPPEAARVNVLYFGSETATDTKQPLFFVQRAFQQTWRQIVQIIARTPDAQLLSTDTENTPVVFVTDALPEARIVTLRRLLDEGRTVFLALRSAAQVATLAKLFDIETLSATEARVNEYSLFAEIDFQHPLFAPFADPRFSDFTKIHFWKHRRLDAAKIPAARVLARFDDGDPALIEASVGRGRIFVLTACWHPEDSQLALSSKFVPLLYSLLEQSGALNTQPTQFIVGNDVPLAFAGMDTNVALTITKPDGARVSLAKGEVKFTQADQPGIYTMATSPQKKFAVNLDPSESRTAPLPLDELERLGLPLQRIYADAVKVAEQKRQLQNTELEGRQKLWRWLVTAALAVLLVETWLASWTTRRAAAVQGEA